MLQRILLFAALLAMFAWPAAAQRTETLFDGDVDHGGFGGPVARLTTIGDDFAVFMGGRGGWIINFSPSHTLVLGGGGYGLATNYEVEETTTRGRPLYLNVGYGGFEIEYVHRTRKLVHLSATALVGGGVVGRRDSDYESVGGDDPIFVFEPGLHVMLNVTHFFRIGAGGSYRYVYGAGAGPVSDAALSRPSAVITLKFGSF